MAETCYRHPDRETRVSCSSCGKPICPECMTPTPVGMRCPECARQKTKVVRGTGGGRGFDRAPATFVLIGLNVLAYLVEIASGGGRAWRRGHHRDHPRLRPLRTCGG